MDDGDHEAVMSYIRLGDGLALSKTIEKAMEDLEIRIEREFSRFDVEEASLKKRTVQKLIVADAATLLLGILGTRLVFRSAMNGAGFGVSKWGDRDILSVGMCCRVGGTASPTLRDSNLP